MASSKNPIELEFIQGWSLAGFLQLMVPLETMWSHSPKYEEGLYEVLVMLDGIWGITFLLLAST